MGRADGLGWRGCFAAGLIGAMMTTGCGADRAEAQTLARKGWAGSGMTVNNWWSNAIFYQVDPLRFSGTAGDGNGALKGMINRLDYLHALGVDALVLSPLPLKQADVPAGVDGAGAIDARYGTEDDFGLLQREASLRKIRLIVDVPVSAARTAEQSAGVARFWLSRGVGGLRMTVDPGAPIAATSWQERANLLRRICAGFSGDRVLLGTAPGVPGQATPVEDVAIPVSHYVRSRRSGRHAARAHARRTASPTLEEPQLLVDDSLLAAPVWGADAMRGAVARGVAGRLIESDAAARPSAAWVAGALNPSGIAGMQKMLAVVLLAGREAPVLTAGQELGVSADGAHAQATGSIPWEGVAGEEADPASLLNWYRRLTELRHDNAALGAGAVSLIDTGYPDVVAWVRRGTSPHEQPVLVVLNASARPLVLSLVEPLQRIGLSASSGVRPLLVSGEQKDAAFTASAIALRAYGVYLGELHQPGLEDAAVPVVRHGRSRRRGR